MIGFIKEELLCMFAILCNVLSFSPQEKQEIANLYRDTALIQEAYNSLESSLIDENNKLEEKSPLEEIETFVNKYNKCQEELPLWHPKEIPIDVDVKDIKTVVIRLSKSSVITLDGIEYLELPAYIECVINDVGICSMILTRIDDSGEQSTLGKIVKSQDQVDGKDLYMTEEVFVLKELKTAYIDNGAMMATEYSAGVQLPNRDHKHFCRIARLRHGLPPEYLIEFACIQIGSYTLLMNESLEAQLPGLLTCIFRDWTRGMEGTTRIIHFVADTTFKNWYRVYTNSRTPIVDRNERLAFEEYLL